MKKNIKLNLIGLRCPEPIMIIRKTLRTINIDDNILIISDDPTTKRDIPNFCYFMEHTLLKYEIKNKLYTYLLKKGL
ncbi:sulfurtransferase TusA [Buchnera aphidicola]|uniref:Sulfur carrier protein TusA n=1 Tax=Buchnera aphidicola str. Ua (Uroleucon ambrosiae) TaxID=1005057 RepID=G2LPT8_BUCUM|nr:sulfurtransferase TusA [Buchnera aphidicola]AEO08225.1 sulfur transfer protein SirA [Buchnera aphidicola str. Ua (Uroleucon ambrosiae)]